MLKPLTVCIITNCVKFFQKMGIPDHLTCHLRNLYASQEVTVRTGHGTTDWFKIGKRVLQGCVLSPCLFNLYAEYILQTARRHEAQAGLKIAGRYINNLRYTVETSLVLCDFLSIWSFFKFFFKLWWVLPYIEMNQPWVYMCSPSRCPLPPPSPRAPSRSSQCTRSRRLSHASNLGWWSVSP